MKRFVLALLAAVSTAQAIEPANAADQYVYVNSAAVLPASAGEPANRETHGERVLELPNDGLKWDLLVFTSPDWTAKPAEAAVVQWFATNPRLAGLKKQVRYHHRTTADFSFKHKWVQVVGNDPKQVPCVILQSAAGHKCFKASGDNLPKTADGLADAIAGKLSVAYNSGELHGMAGGVYAGESCGASAVERAGAGRLRPRPCPGPGPCPNPKVEPLVPPVTTVTTTVVPSVPDDVEDHGSQGFPVGLVLLAGAAAFAVAFIVQIKNAA